MKKRSAGGSWQQRPVESAALIAAICRGVGGSTTAVRSLVRGSCLRSSDITEPLGWTEDALATIRVERSPYAAFGGPEPRPDLRPASEAVCTLTHVIEFAAQAIEAIVSGEPAHGDGPLRCAACADAKLTEFFRSVPEEDFGAFTRVLWGREAAPLRVR